MESPDGIAYIKIGASLLQLEGFYELFAIYAFFESLLSYYYGHFSLRLLG